MSHSDRPHGSPRGWLRLALLLAVMAGVAVAQGPGRGFGRGGFGFGPGPFGFGPGAAFAPAPGSGHHGPVTGLPLTATAQIQSTRTNKAGAATTTTTGLQLARDDQGRTWVEVTLPPRGANGTQQQVIYINDPVARVNYVVYPSRQQAIEHKLPAPRDVNSQGPPPGGGPAWGGRHGQGPQPTTVSLGSQTIAGIQADGTQTTLTFPARGDSDQPTTLTTTRYYSTTLQIVAMEQRSGPRGGQQTYTLLTLQQGTPDASLFTVPSNYTVRTARGPRGGF